MPLFTSRFFEKANGEIECVYKKTFVVVVVVVGVVFVNVTKKKKS